MRNVQNHNGQGLCLGRCLLICFVLLTGCGTSDRFSPFAGTPSFFHPTDSRDRFETEYGGRLHAPDIEKRVRRIAERLLAASPSAGDADAYRFILLAHDSPNAFSFSDRRIYLTAGLLSYLESDDLLAAILAHEVAHIAAGHGRAAHHREKERLRCEIEADQIAAELLHAGGYDPHALLTLISALADVQPATWADARLEALRLAQAVVSEG